MRRLALVLVLALGLAAPADAKPYGTNAGFYPRDRTIGIRLKIPVPVLDRALGYWNGAAGRLLLVRDDAGPITIYNGDAVRGSKECPGGNCAAPVAADGRFSYPPTYPYARCEVYLTAAGAQQWTVVAHELGHCLGYDHDRRSIVGGSGSTAYDRQMLEQVGYRATPPHLRRTRRPRRV